MFRNLIMRRRGQRAWRPYSKIAVVLLSALALKRFYSTASANDLGWILTPTTFLVELVSGRQFEFESYAGYMSSDRSFLIATSCAGINFLITAFLMLSLRNLLWIDGEGIRRFTPWKFLPLAGVVAYLATLLANTIRISLALWLQHNPGGPAWLVEGGYLNSGQLHRFEGIAVYFLSLLLLFLLNERFGMRAGAQGHMATAAPPPKARTSSALRSWQELLLKQKLLFPLIVYYSMAVGMPLANGAYRQGSVFWEHSLFVLLTPLPLVVFMICRAVAKHTSTTLNRRSLHKITEAGTITLI